MNQSYVSPEAMRFASVATIQVPPSHSWFMGGYGVIKCNQYVCTYIFQTNKTRVIGTIPNATFFLMEVTKRRGRSFGRAGPLRDVLD